ncbi:hypothetical protein OYT88_09790 [Sporolactobacillus sp. CQH2019]|uniref:hypothetical protein n=1 Tax=Sporolactobacillus sp. CQH2019 TaxID=3023512 RepID=UPI002367C1D8|nr:hypothetical protein [Sporolactobacillus sp. CQH2019]MDD9148841.1 hypothetical protein [Sporolactobacillus sp. CQH2019]
MPLKEAALQFNKKIKVGFSGGALSSNLGRLLYREFDEKTGFSRLIEERLKIKDPVTHTSHEYEGRGSESLPASGGLSHQ